jgi:hypothetical protein
MKTNAQMLDTASPIHQRFLVGTHLQALEDIGNLQLVLGQLPKLLAQLDADNLTTSNYAATLTPLNPGDVITEFNAILAKLDTDAVPAGANYAALLTVVTVADLVIQWAALLAKLDLDDNTDATYVAKNTLPFLKTLNQEKSF